MEKLITITTLKELQELQSQLKLATYTSFDIETTGVEKESLIIGYSIAFDDNTGYYVVTRKWDVATQKLVDLETIEGTPTFLRELATKELITQNGIFDAWMVENNYGVSLIQSVHTDTMLLSHILDENQRCGLKEIGVRLFGEDAAKEQAEMKASVHKNGGVLTKEKYELYKGDWELIAKYGAKDAILTMKVFNTLIPRLFEEGLDTFFYEESMPLFRGPTYQLNSVGLAVDTTKLQNLRKTVETECIEDLAFVNKEIASHVADKKSFNINANHQRCWLLFEKLQNNFHTLTDNGRDLCKHLGLKLPYTIKDKKLFVERVKELKGQTWCPSIYNYKTKKMSRPKKVGDPWTYMTCGKVTLGRLKDKYKWVDAYLRYKKNDKLLNTYITGIQEKLQYGIIRPSFLQHVTTSGRYSSRHPNFTNLPRDDKRIKSCIVARKGKVFVGADWSQIEPRIFASLSKDVRLLKCFEDGDDFYSVVGAPIFNAMDCTLKKDDTPNSFPVKYKKLRDISKVIALAIPYGTTAPQLSSELVIKANIDKRLDECQEIIDDYFAYYPSVKKLMLESHKTIKRQGYITNMFGRKRRIPEATEIEAVYGKCDHSDLPRAQRNLLNQAMNFPIQSTAASILNRSMIAFDNRLKELGINHCNIILCVHDEIVVECLEKDKETVLILLKECMENTVQLPGVALIAEPKSAYNLADLK